LRKVATTDTQTDKQRRLVEVIKFSHGACYKHACHRVLTMTCIMYYLMNGSNQQR